MITVYGISNCDTVRKTVKWLDSQNLPYQFHDFRKHGLDDELAKTLLEKFNSDQLINRRGTTWRQLSDKQKRAADGVTSIMSLIQEHPAIIRRPVIRNNNSWLLGYNDSTLNALIQTGPGT